MRVAIPGGTGLIGRKLASLLIERGHEPVILTRDPGRVRAGMEQMEFRRWPAGGEEEKTFEGVDAVVNLAGEPIAGGRWTGKRRKRIRDSRVLGTRRLVDAFKGMERKPGVFIAGSAVGYYGSRGDDILLEEEGPGSDFLSSVCVELEEEAAKAEHLGIRIVRIRTAPVLSARGGALPKMLAPFRIGLGGRIGSGRQWFPWIHEDDIARAIAFCLEDRSVAGALNLAAPGCARNTELTSALAKTLGRPARFPVPVFALRIVLGEMSVVLTSSIRAVPYALESSGFEFEYPELGGALRTLLLDDR